MLHYDEVPSPGCTEEEQGYLNDQWEGETDDLEPGDWEEILGGPDYEE